MSRSSKTRLDQAVEDLKAYFGVLSKDDVFNILSGASESKDIKKIYFDMIAGKPPPESGVASIIGLLQSQEHAYFAHEIIEKINKFNTGASGDHIKTLKDTLLVVYEDSEAAITSGGDKLGRQTSLRDFTEPFKAGPKDKPLIPVNQNPQQPSKAKPALSAFVVGPHALNPTKRGTPSAQIFLSAIPTLEMSRCVPFLDVVLVPPTPAISDTNKVQSISMLQFLKGNFEPNDADKTIATAVDLRVKKNILNTPPPKHTDEDKKREDPAMTSAGMEIFTSPQTLVNADESYGDGSVPGHRGAAIIDKFRPLMSLSNFKVDLVPSAGLLSFKTAQMSLVLHDRSRLSEIAEFVKPDLYGKTSMLVTYGWSHPDGLLNDNVYGKFLDSLKCTEQYGIVNSSFTFDQVGQVQISLKLSLKGSSQIELSRITEGTAVATALKDVKKLTEAVKIARSKKRGGKKGSKSVSSSKILSSMSDTRSAMGFDGDIKKEINEYVKAVRKAGSPGDLKKVLPLLKKLQKAIPKAQKSMAAIVDAKLKGHKVKRKFTAKKDKHPQKDPFAQDFKGKISEYINIKSDDAAYTTFGSLVLAFAGAPLCGTGQFDEVQFVFYSFNDKASYMKNASIASFPIKFSTFTEKFKEACKTSTNMPIGAFIKFLTKNFVSSQTAEAYGLSNLYVNDKENPGKKKLHKKFEDEKTGKDLLRSEKDLRLMDAYGISDKDEDFGFKVPRIQMQCECLSGELESQSIYRIHIFDQNATSYSSLSQMLQAAQSDALSSFSAGVSKTAMKKGEDKSGNKATMISHINRALTAGIIAADPETTSVSESDFKDSGGVTFRVKTDFQKVKNFIAQSMPSLMYGTSNTNITSANLASMNNPALTNINMRRSGMGNGISALGLREAGLPLQIAPTSLSMTSFGFPIATIGQTFFVDFGTGTSADNIYCCSKVSHDISAGKFETSWTFQPLNAYGAYTAVGSSISRAIKEIEAN